MIIGLLGSHRTGKTTLAKAYADKHGLHFVETSVSAIFKRMKIDPAAKFSFSQRLDIQEEILKVVDGLYAQIDPSIDAITDRTPLDMLAYLKSEAIGDAVSDADQERFASYVSSCFEITNRRFGSVILVQPGIPVEAKEGKAAANLAYMEHLNSLMFGLSLDPRLKISSCYIQRSVLSLEARIESVEMAVDFAFQRADRELNKHFSSGGLLH